MDLTSRVLNRLRGHLDITICHPSYAGKLIVRGVNNCPAVFAWKGMPEEMKVDRMVYCCRPAWDEALPAIFVFADDVTVVDAPADMVVDEMLDMMYELGLDNEVDRLENPDEVWHEEEE